MTDELGREKLLNILETAFSHLLKDINYKETRARYEQAKEQIKALIQKPVVTEDWIEKKARVLKELCTYDEGLGGIEGYKNFIRSLVEEIPAKKATVSEEVIFSQICKTPLGSNGAVLVLFKKMLTEAGVEVKK